MAELSRKITTHYVTPEGKRCRKGTPGAVPRTHTSRKWGASGSPVPRGKWIPLSADRGTAQVMLARLVERLHRGEAGLPDRAELRRPLAEHLERWRQAQLSRPDADPSRVRLVAGRVSRLVAGCAFATAADIDPDAVSRWLASQRATQERKGRPFGATTANHHVAHLSQFCRWLMDRGVLSRNPAARVPRGDARDDLRQARRELAPEELRRLLDTTRAGPTRRHVSGLDRHWLYLLACATGFRRSELWQLRPSWFALDATPPTVLMPGRVAKAGKAAVLPLPASVVPGLRQWLAGRPEAPLWPANAREAAVCMLRLDLAAAGIPFVDVTPEGPRRVDFHALRHTYITMLDVSGASAREAQALARHATPQLTVGTYTHTSLQRLAVRVDALPLGETARTLESLPHAELVAVTEYALTLAGVFAALFAAPGVTLWDSLRHHGTETGAGAHDATATTNGGCDASP
jgi:integrase/recombinase XerD